jgi:hypothetical protein
VSNAPPEVVEQERTRVIDFKRDIAQLDEQTRRVAAMKK